MILRSTGKALALLGDHAGQLLTLPPSDDDWYLNLLWLDRRKCLLLVHAETLFPVLIADVRAADLRPLGPFVVEAIAAELDAEGLRLDALGHLDGSTVCVAKTASRSVLGFMNEMAFYLNYTVADTGGLNRANSRSLNHGLRRQLHSRGGYATPLELVDRPLRKRRRSA